MAQTSTRKKSSVGDGTRRRSSRSTRASASSSGSRSTRNRQSRNGRGANGRKSGASRSGRSRAPSTSGRKRSSASSSSQGPADAVKQIGSKGKEAVAEGAHTGGKAISSAAGKVKWPAVAGGAALAGLAGGVALGAQRNSGRKILGMRVGQGRGEAGKNLADTSKNIGKFSENVGQFAAEMRKTREAIESGSKHSSPIEVVLRALTARR
jgi:hypothetical protein